MCPLMVPRVKRIAAVCSVPNVVKLVGSAPVSTDAAPIGLLHEPCPCGAVGPAFDAGVCDPVAAQVPGHVTCP